MSKPIQSLSSRVCPTVCLDVGAVVVSLLRILAGARTKADPKPAPSVGLGNATTVGRVQRRL